MENNNIEIYIKTQADENQKKSGLQEGSSKLSARHDMMYHTIRKKVALNEKDNENRTEEEKAPFLENILSKTNQVIDKVVENIAQNIKHENVKTVEVEFGISFSEKMNIYLFETGAQQSLKFKVTIEK